MGSELPPTSQFDRIAIDRRLVLIVLGISLVASITLCFIVDEGRQFMLVFALIVAASFLLAWFGQVRLAALFVPVAILIILTIFIVQNKGIRDTAILGFPVVIVAGSLLNGRRGAILFGVICLLIVTGLAIGEFSGLLQWEGQAQNTLSDYLVVGMILVITVAIQWAVISRLIENSAVIGHELAERMRTEAALRESEERYRTVVDTFPDLIVISNLRGEVMFANPALEEQTGHDWKRMTTPISNFIHPEDAEMVSQAVRDLLMCDGSCTDLIENRFIHKNGDVLWYRGLISKVQYQGELCLQTVTRQITDQKAAEFALKESEERYRLISFVTSDYTFSTQRDSEGKMQATWVAGAFESITGYTFSEYKEAGGWSARLHPEDVEKDLAALSMVEHNQPVIHEVRTLTKDNEVRWVRVYAHPMWDDKEQALAGIVGAVQDITERKNAEEKTTQANLELQRRVLEMSILNAVSQAGAASEDADEILEKVVDSLYNSLYPDIVGIALWDEESGLLRTHPRANRGIPEFIDQGSLAVRPNEGIVGLVAATRQPKRLKDTSDPQYQALFPGINSELCVPILAGDRLIGVLNIESRHPDAFSDSDEHLLVTIAGQLASAIERLRAEQELRKLNIELEHRVAERTALLEEANKELEAFSYSVSHDLRAPLRRIKGFAQILQEDFPDSFPDEANGYLEKLIGSAGKMSQLIDGLLDLSRLGRKSLARMDVDLNALVRVVIDSLGIDDTHLPIEWTISELPVVNGDPVLLQQVFVNLLGNSVKYTTNQAVAQIHVGSRTQNGNPVIFVKDNGVGFDMQYADQLFGVFQRFHSDEEFEGMGIGLAIVRRIVERHGGKIWAESAVDEGAAFYFTLG